MIGVGVGGGVGGGCVGRFVGVVEGGGGSLATHTFDAVACLGGVGYGRAGAAWWEGRGWGGSDDATVVMGAGGGRWLGGSGCWFVG